MAAKKRGTRAERAGIARVLDSMRVHQRAAVRRAQNGDCGWAAHHLTQAALNAHSLTFRDSAVVVGTVNRSMTKAHMKVQRYCPRQTSYRR